MASRSPTVHRGTEKSLLLSQSVSPSSPLANDYSRVSTLPSERVTAGANTPLSIRGLEDALDHLHGDGRQPAEGPWEVGLEIQYRGQEGRIRLEMLPDGILQSITVGGQAPRTTHIHTSINDTLVRAIVSVMKTIRAEQA